MDQDTACEAPSADGGLAFAGEGLDRLSASRSDPQRMAELWTQPGTLVLPVWRGMGLVGPEGLMLHPAGAELGPGERCFVGLLGGRALFAVDLSTLDQAMALEATRARQVRPLRELAGLVGHEELNALGCAASLFAWHDARRFCGVCGGRTVSLDAGHRRSCPECGATWFPTIAPAIIVLVEAPAVGEDRCLMVTRAGASESSAALVAGYVEPAEALEDAVRREVREEAGLELDDIRYAGSQGWPFPDGLMLGFRARARSLEARPDGREIGRVAWITRAQAAAHFRLPRRMRRAFSIEQRLVEQWLAEKEGSLSFSAC